MANPNLQGIVVYNRIGDGCLNGIWTNNLSGGRIMNECARKKDTDITCLAGEYTVTWIDENHGITNGTLEIVRDNLVYNLTWKEGKTTLFYGIGIDCKETTFSAAFWEA